MASLLWLVFAVLLVLWLVGFAVNWGAFIWKRTLVLRRRGLEPELQERDRPWAVAFL